MSFLWKWVKDFILVNLGLAYKRGNIIFVGLDNAGKTTLLGKLSDDRLSQPMPTLYPGCAELKLGNIIFKTFDVGGHKQVRHLWTDYFFAIDGVVFILDVSERARFDDAYIELHNILKNETVGDMPILILGNKTDKPGAASEQEILERFRLSHLVTGKDVKKTDRQPIELFMCSILNEEGYGDAFRWFANFF